MVYYLTIFLVFWALIYTAARFLRYFRIVKEYKEEAKAEIISISRHDPSHRKEPPAMDVALEYSINGKTGRTEVIMPDEQAARYSVGDSIDIKYRVEENGTVHVSSAGDAPRKLMYAYLAAIVLELVIYYVIWHIMQ